MKNFDNERQCACPQPWSCRKCSSKRMLYDLPKKPFRIKDTSAVKLEELQRALIEFGKQLRVPFEQAMKYINPK